MSSDPYDVNHVVSMLETMDKFIELKKLEKHFNEEDLQPVNPPVKERSSPSRSCEQRASFAAKAQELRKRKREQRNARNRACARYPLNAVVILARNNRAVRGQARNISKTGIFVEQSAAKIFKEGETIRLLIKPKGASRFYKSIGRVRRTPADGYGLEFVRQASGINYSRHSNTPVLKYEDNKPKRTQKPEAFKSKPKRSQTFAQWLNSKKKV